MPCLQGPGADVIDDSISEYIVLYIFLPDMGCLAADDDCQLCLVIQIRYNIPVAWDACPGIRGTVYPLGKIDGMGSLPVKCFLLKSGRFLSVSHVIDSQTDNILPRMGNRG